MRQDGRPRRDGRLAGPPERPDRHRQGQPLLGPARLPAHRQRRVTSLGHPLLLRRWAVVAFLAGAWAVVSPVAAAAADAVPRQRLSLNADWRFHKGDLEGHGALDDSTWRRL